MASISQLSDLDGALIRYVWGAPASFDSNITGPQGVGFWRNLFEVLKPGAFVVMECSHKEIFHLGILLRVAGFSVRDTLFIASDAVVGEGGSLYIFACRPVDYNYAYNTMQYGVGGLNIVESRFYPDGGGEGKWPANVLHDGSADDVPQDALNPHSHTCSRFFKEIQGGITSSETLRYFGALICPPGGTLVLLGADSMSCGSLLEYGINVVAVSEGGHVENTPPAPPSCVPPPEELEDISILALWGL